jgi:hypothetical protein
MTKIDIEMITTDGILLIIQIIQNQHEVMGQWLHEL